MINRRVAALLVLVTPLAACVTGSDSTTPSPNPNAAFTARFTPLGGMMPFPNDLYFSGSTTGTLNIPGSATVAQNAPLLALNHLDGFGTESDINIYFTQPVDATTLTANTVLVFKVASSATNKAVDPTQGATLLTPGKDYSVGLSPGIDSGGEIVTIKPVHPLAPSTVNPTTLVPKPSTYLVVVTNGVKDQNGDAVAASPDYSTIVAADSPALAAGGDLSKIALSSTDPLLPVAQFTLPQLAVVAGAKIPLANVAITFSFSTAYLGLSLGELSAGATATTQPTTGTGIFTTGKTVCDILVLSKQLPNNAACAAVPHSTDADVYAGDLALPYYLTVPSANDPTAALTDSWHNAKGGDTAISTDPTSLLPKATVPQNIIPVLVAIPNATSVCGGTMPVGGWPVAIFQHGITRNREDMFGMASGLAGGACIAVIAIDLPLHGVTDTTDPFYKNQLFKGTPAGAALTAPVSERTFDMDLENNTTLAAGPDGKIDSSGAWFINLTSTITSRDNLREGAADLINLVATLPNLHTIGATTGSFNSAAVFYVGHSLGGIVGTTFLGADTAGTQFPHTVHVAPRIAAAVLANPGGHIAQLLQDSATFGPLINSELATNGIPTHTQSYYDFYSEAQAVVEDGDPANYAAFASQGHLIHMLEVVGGLDAGSPPDQVVPNSATDVLIAQMGISTPVSAVGPNAIAVGAPTLAQFISGDHGSFLSPTAPTGASPTDQAAYAAVTTEMQLEMGNLFGGFLLGAPATVVTSNTYLTTSLKN